MDTSWAMLLMMLLGQPAPLVEAARDTGGGPPVIDLPGIIWHTPEQIDDAWRAVRKIAGHGARLVEIDRRSLRRWACSELVDMQSGLPAVAASGLAWKDVVRGRGWGRAALVRVLASAHATWHLAHPDRVLSVGDVAQAGCGQIDPSVLTRLVAGAEAEAVVAAARPIGGRVVVRELTRAGALADDPSRFASADDVVMIERELVARGARPDDATPVVLVHVRRYVARPGPNASELATLGRDLKDIVTDGEVAREEVFVEAGEKRVRRHIIDVAGSRQAVIVTTRKGRVRLDDVIDLRIGPWLPGRPGVFQGESRWLASGDEAAPWAAWQALEEGAHATHMAGRDADMSYAYADATQRFSDTVDAISAIDLPATWAWFSTLEATGQELGTPIDSIIVGPRVYRRLLAEIPGARASTLVTKHIVRVVRAHDDHQHVRIAEPSPVDDANAATALRAVAGDP